MTPDTNTVFRRRLRRMDPLAYRLFAEIVQLQVGRKTVVEIPGAGPFILEPGMCVVSWPDLAERLEYDWNRGSMRPTVQQLREAMRRLSSSWPEGTTTGITTGLLSATTTGQRILVKVHYKAKTEHRNPELQQGVGGQLQQGLQQGVGGHFQRRLRGVMEDEHGNRIYAKE